jgi:hypothetical protein
MNAEITVTSDIGPFALIPEWVIDLDVSTGAFRLYAVLSRYADWNDGTAFPSRQTLANRLRCSTDTVDRWAAELVAAKCLLIERRIRTGQTGNVRNITNLYRVIRTAPVGRQDAGSRKDAATPSRNGTAKGSRKDAAQTIPIDLDPPTKSEVVKVFEAWVAATGKDPGRTRLDDKRRRKIVDALKTYPVNEVIEAVEGWKHSPFHAGENERGTVYNDLTLILRDSANIERFRDLRAQHRAKEAVQVRPKWEPCRKGGCRDGWIIKVDQDGFERAYACPCRP